MTITLTTLLNGHIIIALHKHHYFCNACTSPLEHIRKTLKCISLNQSHLFMVIIYLYTIFSRILHEKVKDENRQTNEKSPKEIFKRLWLDKRLWLAFLLM